MPEPSEEAMRVMTAASAIIGDRDPKEDVDILITTEHVVATILIAMFSDPHQAAGMLNEGLVQGIENRLSLYKSKQES